MFKQNEGWADRDIRVMVGMAGLLIAAFFPVFGFVVQVIAGTVGVILVLTAAVGFCPLYAMFGINTCKIDAKKK